jgi:hypothetical protein
MLDRKTGERAEFLFATRAKRVAKHYINEKIIPCSAARLESPPATCAAVPGADEAG